MQINQSETSRAAFAGLKKEKKIQPMESKILAAMAAGREYTRQQLAKMTRMELSSVCGRVKSLLQAGRVEIKGEATDPKTGKRRQTIGLPSAQMGLFQ